MKRSIPIALLLILGSTLALADTYSLVDPRYLPTINVYDPIEQQNRPIIEYSFEELDYLMWNNPSFLRWNNGERLCESMRIMFGRASSRCANLPVRVRTVARERDVYVLPQVVDPQRTTSRAHVTINIQPRPQPIVRTSRVVVVDPVYPPYAHRPYAWWP